MGTNDHQNGSYSCILMEAVVTFGT